MQKARSRRPSAALVVSVLALFVALGGASYAATQLPANSVGTKQLKKNAVANGKIRNNAVTTAKLRKNAVATAKIRQNAVTRAKIKAGAVNSAKIADGSVTGTDINAPSTPFSQVVFTTQGQSAVAIPKTGFVAYPLNPGSYTQAANRSDSYIGAMEVVFKPTCTAPRSASAYVLVDPENPAVPDESSAASIGYAADKAGGEVTKRLNLVPYYVAGVQFRRGTPTDHTLSLAVKVECTGGTEGAQATSAEVDVLGVTK